MMIAPESPTPTHPILWIARRGLALALLLGAAARPAAAQSTGADTSRSGGTKASPASTNDPFITGVWHPENYASGTGAATNRSAITGVYFPDRPPPPRDSARAAVKDSSASPNSIVTIPVDLAVAEACGHLSAGSQAPGLLAVRFAAGTTEAQRAAVAKQAAGALAGRSAYGDDYVRALAIAGPTSALADRLARLDHVLQVSPVSCPSPARVEAALRAARAAAPCAPADSSAAAKPGAVRSKGQTAR